MAPHPSMLSLEATAIDPIAANRMLKPRSPLPNSSAHHCLIIFHGGRSTFVHSLSEILKITEQVSESNLGYARIWL